MTRSAKARRPAAAKKTLSATLKPVRAVARNVSAASQPWNISWGFAKGATSAMPALELLVEADSLAGREGEFVAAVCESILHQAARGFEERRLSLLEETILRAEVPLSLAAASYEARERHELVTQASAAWSQLIVEATDGEGMLPARAWEERLPLLGSWTRCLLRAELLGVEFGDAAARQQFTYAVRQALRYARSDGSPILCGESARGTFLELLRIAVRLSGDAENLAIASQSGLLPASRAKTRKSKASKSPAKTSDAEPDPKLAASNQAEDAGVGILRADWSARSPRLSVLFGRDPLELEIESAGELLVSGAAEPELRVGGRLLAPTGPWEQTCWIAEPGGDYLEIEREYADGWAVQRQMLLLRESRAIYLADAVLGPATAEIDYRVAYPLAGGSQFHAYPSTREGELQRDGKPLVRLLPLALPEWLSASTAGAMGVDEGKLRLRQRASADRLHTALFIDLDPRRIKKPATWRQLTIGEKLQIVPANVAVAYRVQSGSDQWLFYRSLGEKGNRTVLGMNLISEFLAAKFTTAGKAEAIVEVE